MPGDKKAIHTVYKLANGQRVPSVTTFLGVLGKPALIHWAWECGVQGLDYRKVRDEAGDTGELVHYLILCLLKGEKPDLADCSPQLLLTTASPMGKFNKWLLDKTIEPILLETPMVSEVCGFGGTPDFYGKVDGVLTLLDFKTGKDIYQEAFYQIAAYIQLLREQGQHVAQAKIIRLGKSDDEGFEERMVGKLENHWQIFLACKKIYELQRTVRQNKGE